MPKRRLDPLRALIVALCAGLAPTSGALAADGRFVAISDVHLDPFTGTAADARILASPPSEWPSIYAELALQPADYGSDANVPLLAASLSDAAARVPAPDFVIYPGDFVVHRLSRKIAAAGGDPDEATRLKMAVGITRYLADRLRARFPDAPILPALGNTDAACGDYRIEPGGAYLDRTFPILRALVGADRLADDAATTWRAGGYYAARHPTVASARFVVLNNVLWSTKYENACAGQGAASDPAPGEAMLAWLDRQLAAARAAGETVHLVYHVPPGANAYGTAHAGGAGACRQATVPFWRETWRAAFSDLMARDGDIVVTGYSGHIHRDSWRLFRAGEGRVEAFVNIVPAISPIYGNAPAYQVFTYDRSTGALRDKETIAVTNLSAAAAGTARLAFSPLYRFEAAYRAGPLGPSALATVSQALATAEPSADRTLYARYYGSGHGDDPEKAWPVYGCAPGNALLPGFDACHCGNGDGPG